MSRNIKTAYVLTFLSELYFPVSIWLFYYLRFMDFRQIAILTSVRVISSNIFEIPTGAVADLYGRRTAIFLSFFLYGLVMFGFAFTQVFWVFIILEVSKALSSALYSGSMEALVYDSLKQEKKEEMFDKVIANMQTCAWFALFISSILGGFLFYYQFNLPYLLQGVVYLSAAFLAFRVVEPRIDTAKYKLQDIWLKNIQGFKELTKNIQVTQISFLFITLGAGYFIASELLGISQAREYGLDSRAVGILFAGGYIISALASQAYPRLKELFGRKVLLFSAAIILIGSFILAQYVGAVLGCLLIIMRISKFHNFH